MTENCRQLDLAALLTGNLLRRTRRISLSTLLVCSALIVLPNTPLSAKDVHVRSTTSEDKTEAATQAPPEQATSNLQKPSDLPEVRRETTLIATEPYVSPTFDDRIEWALRRSLGWRSMATGTLQSGIKTWQNTPEEWGSGWEGFGKRLATRQADVLISSTVEASLGALWGEDPRYWRSGKDGTGGRLWYAVSSAFLTYRRDGTRNFAWARLAGNVSGDAVVRRWYPDGERDWYKWTLTPLGTGFFGKIFSNVFREFSPDLKRKFLKKGKTTYYNPNDKQDKKGP